MARKTNNCSFLKFDPVLANGLGILEALIIALIVFRQAAAKEDDGGIRWVTMSVASIRKVIPRCESVVADAISRLVDEGIVLRAQRSGTDRSYSYAINAEMLHERFPESHIAQEAKQASHSPKTTGWIHGKSGNGRGKGSAFDAKAGKGFESREAAVSYIGTETEKKYEEEKKKIAALMGADI